MSMRRSPQAGRSGRRTAGRTQRDQILDPYQAQQKLQEPTACRPAVPSTITADGNGGKNLPVRMRVFAPRATASTTDFRPAP